MKHNLQPNSVCKPCTFGETVSKPTHCQQKGCNTPAYKKNLCRGHLGVSIAEFVSKPTPSNPHIKHRKWIFDKKTGNNICTCGEVVNDWNPSPLQETSSVGSEKSSVKSSVKGTCQPHIRNMSTSDMLKETCTCGIGRNAHYHCPKHGIKETEKACQKHGEVNCGPCWWDGDFPIQSTEEKECKCWCHYDRPWRYDCEARGKTICDECGKPCTPSPLQETCICLEDNKMTQALCPVHGVKETEKTC